MDLLVFLHLLRIQVQILCSLVQDQLVAFLILCHVQSIVELATIVEGIADMGSTTCN